MRPRISDDNIRTVREIELQQGRDASNIIDRALRLGLRAMQTSTPAPAPPPPQQTIHQTLEAMSRIRERCDPLVSALEKHARAAGDANAELAGFLSDLPRSPPT